MLAVVIVDSFAYKLTFLLHILAIVVAFAPAFVYPGVSRSLRGHRDGGARAALAGLAANDLRIHAPSLVAAGLLGILLVLQSDDAYSLADAWISAAFLVWFLMVGVLVGLLVPAERKAAAGEDPAAEKLVRMFGGTIHLLLLVMLYLMIWKPGA
ncbi:hypothetical protein BH20ACT2_BH20ACT2_12350 [soil metagenome]